MSEADFLASIGSYADAVALVFRVLALGWFSGAIGLALATARTRR